MGTQVKRDEIPEDLRSFYDKACQLYEEGMHYTEFSNTFFRQGAPLMKCFPTKKAQEAFSKSPLCLALQEMKESLFEQQEFSEQTQVYFSNTLRAKLKNLSEREGVSMNALINEFIEEVLARRETL